MTHTVTSTPCLAYPPAMSTQPPPPAGAWSKIKDGVAAIGRSIWFVISLMLYAIGTTLRVAGTTLIHLSGWEQPNATDRPPRAK